MKRPCETCGRFVIVCSHCETQLDDDGYSHACPRCQQCSETVVAGSAFCRKHLDELPTS